MLLLFPRWRNCERKDYVEDCIFFPLLLFKTHFLFIKILIFIIKICGLWLFRVKEFLLALGCQQIKFFWLKLNLCFFLQIKVIKIVNNRVNYNYCLNHFSINENNKNEKFLCQAGVRKRRTLWWLYFRLGCLVIKN